MIAAFYRLLLIAGCCVLFGALKLLFGWAGLAEIAALSVFFAAVLSVEWDEPPVEKPERPQRPRTDSDGRPQGFERIHG